MIIKLLLVWLVVALASTLLASEPTLDIRTLECLGTVRTRAGATVRAVALSAVQQDGGEAIPAGTLLFGVVKSVHRVGLGLVRERASLEIEFHEYELPDGRSFPLKAQLVSVDNAREEITSKGRIKGILAANAPHSLANGLWRLPNAALVGRSASGLVGLSGMVGNWLNLGPVGSAALFATRLAVLRMPEPEISYPAGTEMRLRVLALPDDAPVFPLPAEVQAPAPLAATLADMPARLQRIGGGADADIMNMAFLGTRHELKNAFIASGWSRAEPLTARSITRAYRALTRMEGYQSAPVSTLTYQGRKADLVFQKSLNSLAKRHHIRVWRAGEYEGRELWVGAATHDIGIAFDLRRRTITHRIDSHIDGERQKIVNDLVFSGCAAPAGEVERPDASWRGIVTDNKMALLSMAACAPHMPSLSPVLKDCTTARFGRLIRRFNLETKNYIIRGNVWYFGYRAVRWTFFNPARAAEAAY